MPYKTVSELPSQFDKLPAHAQEIAINVINSCLAKGDSEESSFKQAWAAVKKAYKQDADGNWIKLEEDMETVNISNVEVLAVGTWHGTPETKTYDRKDLDEIVKSFKELTGNKQLNYEPPIKLGHDPAQKLLQKDGYPAAGWISSLKRVGDKLVANIKEVPRKIGDIVKASGYKKVSSEIYHEYEMGGKVYPLVLKAVSFLGGDIPAVKTLDDIVAQYGDSQEEQLDIVIYEMGEKSAVSYDELATGLAEWLTKVEEKIRGRIGAPTFRTFASEVKGRLKAMLAKETQHEESLDAKTTQVREAFRQARQRSTNVEAYPWVREVYDSSIIVESAEGLNRIPYAMNEEGVIAFDFDKQVKVEISYASVPETDDTENKNKEEDMEIRELLKLGEGADVLEAVKALQAKAESKDKEGTVSLAEYQATETKVTTLEHKLAERDRDERITQAVQSGKITPAQAKLPAIMTLAEKDPSGFQAFVESQPVIVKLGEVGTSGGEAVELTEAEISLAEKMGVSKEDLLAAKKTEVK